MLLLTMESMTSPSILFQELQRQRALSGVQSISAILIQNRFSLFSLTPVTTLKGWRNCNKRAGCGIHRRRIPETEPEIIDKQLRPNLSNVRKHQPHSYFDIPHFDGEINILRQENTRYICQSELKFVPAKTYLRLSLNTIHMLNPLQHTYLTAYY